MSDAGGFLDIVQKTFGGCLKNRNTAENEVRQLSLIEALAENIIIDTTILSLWEYSHRLVSIAVMTTLPDKNISGIVVSRSSENTLFLKSLA